jgi:hypothetical protein
MTVLTGTCPFGRITRARVDAQVRKGMNRPEATEHVACHPKRHISVADYKWLKHRRALLS